ncbi:MAG TPA: HAD family phosphatase [Phycisphaerales bacterium]|nr:HAD family phosphatase [Phycisphaerales bacterium]
MTSHQADIPRPPSGAPLVTFDLGGVIVRICRSIKEAGDRCGIEVRPEDITPDHRAARRAIHARYERGQITCDEFFTLIARTTSGRFTPEQFRAIHEAWIIDEYPGVGTLIDDLNARGIPTGVLSNTNHIHWSLQMQPRPAADGRTIPSKFPTTAKPIHRHASHLLGLAKPDPAIYHEYARRTGFAPADILFFDDRPENVEAAIAAGWRSHLIDPDGDTAAQMRAHLRGIL